MQRKFVLVFALLCMLDLYCLASDCSIRVLTKPLIMTSLIVGYRIYSPSPSPLFTFALLMALAGDLFLVGKSEGYFLVGLASFLIMQILYTMVFMRDKVKPSPVVVVASIIVVIISALSILYLNNGLTPDFKIPVFVYTLCISLMVLSALWRKRDRAYLFIIIGAVSFMVSDLCLAINKFLTPLLYGDMIVMVTYIIAQLLIVEGIIKKEALLNA